jgi:putative DNA primase/helicase
VTIPEEEQDQDLIDKLSEELPGILAWAVRGCLEWQETGLKPPKEVLQATKAYRDEMDILADFVEECCIVDSTIQAAAKELYEAYEEWCEENGEAPIKKRTFGTKLKERGFIPAKSGGRRMWRGLGLKVIPEP